MRADQFDHLVNRKATGSIKWDKYKDRDVIPLWVADMDFRSPKPVIKAIKKRADHGVFGYTAVSGELVETVCSYLEKKFGWIIEPNWLVWLPGLVTGINIACRAIGDDGDDVLTTVPIYPPFLSAPKLSRRNLVTFPMVLDDNRWHIDFDQMEKNMTSSTRLFLFCSPHNPTGRLFSRWEMEKVFDICERHDVVVCSDEIHCDLVLEESRCHIPMATLSPEVAKRTITLMAPSKTYNIPGLGCSFGIISNDSLRRRFQNAMAGIVPHVNIMGYTAALAAYRNGEEWLRAVLDYLRDNKNMVLSAIRSMEKLSVSDVEATYLAWIDARKTALHDPTAFFEKAGVGLFDGRDFGMEGFLRLNFGTSRSILKEALNRMRSALLARFGM